MMTHSLLRITQQRIEEAFVELQKEVANYQRLQINIRVNIERLRNFNVSLATIPFSSDTLNFIFTLRDANIDMETISHHILREIDTITAEIAGYLTLLLEECMANYKTSLKLWIRSRLERLNEFREIKVQGTSQWIAFPAAVATLIPYIIKTRTCSKNTAERLVSIRQQIHSISERSY